MKYSSLLLATTVAVTLAACGGGGGGSESGMPAAPTPPAAAANSPPTISSVASQSIAQDAVSDPIAYEVSDSQLATVTMTADSSNPELIATDAISLTGNGGSRALMLTPTAGESGTAKVTLTATDAQGASSQQSFDVTVTSEQRSFREMVGAAYGKETETEGEQIVGYSWVDTAEDDEAAFDNLFTQ
jgi:hypothetical protein